MAQNGPPRTRSTGNHSSILKNTAALDLAANFRNDDFISNGGRTGESLYPTPLSATAAGKRQFNNTAMSRAGEIPYPKEIALIESRS